MRDTYVYVCKKEISREKKRKRLGANTQKNRANRGHSLKANLSSFSVLVCNTAIGGFHSHAIKIKKWKPPIKYSKSRIWQVKEDKYTKSLSKNQVCAIFHMRNIRKKSFTQIYKALYRDAMFVSLSGAQIWPPETDRNICF